MPLRAELILKMVQFFIHIPNLMLKMVVISVQITGGVSGEVKAPRLTQDL